MTDKEHKKWREAWIKSLREHPERQGRNFLAVFNYDKTNYQACCLGEAVICYSKLKNLKLNIQNKFLISSYSIDNNNNSVENYKEYRFFSSLGRLKSGHSYTNKYGDNYHSLASMNDSGISWKEIADFIENNLKLVFTHLKTK